MLLLCELRNCVSFVGLGDPKEDLTEAEHCDSRTVSRCRQQRRHHPFRFPTPPGLWLHLLTQTVPVACSGDDASVTHTVAELRQRGACSYQPVILKSL